jgi:hypothetical protein
VDHSLHLNVHRATDILRFSLAYPRWELVFGPTIAAYLNLIELWWNILRSSALKGRRFETWDEIVTAVAAATAYSNARRRPFAWGRRRRTNPVVRQAPHGFPASHELGGCTT